MSDKELSIAELTPEEKRALLAKLLEERSTQSDRDYTVYPLSYGQQALFYLHQEAPSSSAYNLAFSCRFKSALDTGALRKAFQSLVSRHASLRTVYTYQNGLPVQKVMNHQDCDFAEIDATSTDPSDLDRRVKEDYSRPFDLEAGPLLRVSLYRRPNDESLLLVTIHHIAYDGWSHWMMLNELEALYLANTRGSVAELPAEVTQFVDFVDWQTDMLAGEEGKRLEAYWAENLAGDLPTLNLPTDRVRPRTMTYSGESYRFKVDNALTSQLKALSKRQGVTLYMTLVAAFQTYLCRISGQEEVLLGAAVSGRTQPQFANVVGDFINSVVLRGTLVGDPTFAQYLEQVRKTVLNALDHQDYPFPLLVSKLQPQRDVSRSPLFQVFFNYLKPQQAGAAADLLTPTPTPIETNWAGLNVVSHDLAQQEGQFDLVLEVVESENDLYGVFKYRTTLFDRETIVAMARNLMTMLEFVAGQPDARVSQIDIINPEQRQCLLHKWNDTKTPDPVDKNVFESFEARVAESPDALAVVQGDTKLTYLELNQRANQVARHLKRLGVGPETLVGILVDRSLEMVVGLLGILKARGAYIPLDPDYPRQRLDYMVEHSGLAYLLTQSSLANTITVTAQTQVVTLDGDWDSISTQPTTNLVPSDFDSAELTLDHLAYVIYTSGSTGKPKGVQIPHGALANFLGSMSRFPGLSNQDRLLAVTTISFDISINELFLPLIVGATIVLAKQDDVRDGDTLLNIVRQHAVTALQATPTTWRLLLASGWNQQNPLKAMCGGEPLPQELADEILETGSALFNMYGPTETTIWSTCAKVESGEPVHIGRPLDNTQLYILDSALQLLPVGVPGELYIGGDGVARGYLNQDNLTEERFIANPFDESGESKIYRTGDLACYKRNGEVEHLGRIDTQVKVRGYRIELEEIEAVLSQHNAVRQSVVVAREDNPGDVQLVAYVVNGEADTASTDELSKWLRTQLPAYMVPSAFVSMERFPLTDNGKVNRLELPAPNADVPLAETESVAARNPVEQKLIDIWKSVLGVGDVGVHDDFFDIGGHSLLATQVIFQLRDSFDVEISVRHLFEAPTIAELVEQVDFKEAMAG